MIKWQGSLHMRRTLSTLRKDLITTKKQRFQYGISGYRWSPESFHVTKGLVGQKKKPLPLTRAERREVGYRVITKGFQAAISYIKQIERKRPYEYENQLYVTYGFWLKEDPKRYLFCKQVYCRADAPLAKRLSLFKMIRNDLLQRNCQVVTSEQCELDDSYQPINIKTNTVTADLSRPLVVRLRFA